MSEFSVCDFIERITLLASLSQKLTAEQWKRRKWKHFANVRFLTLGLALNHLPCPQLACFCQQKHLQECMHFDQDCYFYTRGCISNFFKKRYCYHQSNKHHLYRTLSNTPGVIKLIIPCLEQMWIMQWSNCRRCVISRR